MIKLNEYLKEQELNNYLKYNTFHKEASKKWKNDLSKVQNWKYDEEKDEYICGYGRRLVFVYEKQQKSENGHTSTIRVYRGNRLSGLSISRPLCQVRQAWGNTRCHFFFCLLF